MKKIFYLLILSTFLLNLISAQDITYCCEKTTNGAWCQNTEEENCDSSFRKAPTSCEATSYCKKGCCYNSQEGTCMENSPQKNCENLGGVWEATADCEIPQCQLGCCLIGDQASFVTQTRCKRLASVYGLDINFRTDISSEIMCIASTTSESKGACVFEKEFEKTCLFTTQKKCQEIKGDFHKDYLCSAEALGTNCGPTERTTCVNGKDEMYFLDSCGNLANIYDASLIKNKEYWSKIYRKDQSCNPSSSNKNSATCGNCDYFLGSTCKEYQREETTRPTYGENICKDLSCTYLGKKYQHGETWCANSQGTQENLPGSRYFRLVCYNGDVTIEPCADYRQEICIESEIEGFRTAACRVNRWQDCTSQDKKKDCENEDKRDCIWKEENPEEMKCIPKNSPGLNFWEIIGEGESDSESLCSLGTTTCTIKYEKKLGGGKECVENCECEGENWEKEMEKTCSQLADCGISKNYIGIPGYDSSEED